MSITYLLKKYCKIMYQLKLLFVILISIVSANSFSQTSLEVVPVYKKNNLDNSTTLYNPKAKLYGIEKSLSGQNKGICKLFGYDHYLSSSSRDTWYSTESNIEVDGNGDFRQVKYKSVPITQITCYNSKVYRPLGSSNHVIHNVEDDTYTIMNPLLLRGNDEVYIYSSPEGICSLFGHDSFVSGSAFDFGYTISEMSASLDDDGEFKGFAENKSPYFRVTCRNNTFLWW